MFLGGSSKKQGPRIAMRNADDDPPRDAPVRPCEWSLDEFMIQAGFKAEFDEYVRNAELEDFISDKCRQYYHLTNSFVRRFKFTSPHNSTLFYLIYMIDHIPWT